MGGGTGGGMPPDTTPPVIVQTTPTTGSMGVSSQTTIQFVFSEPMNTSGVLYLFSPMITFNAGAAVWSMGNTVLTLTPASPLTFSTSYSVTVTGQDVAGNGMNPAYSYQFAVEAMPDTTGPSILTVSPDYASTNVPTTSGLLVTFNEPMNPSSVMVSASPSLTLGTPTWANNNTEFSVSPTSPMAANTSYSLAVTGSDVAGNMLVASGTPWTFTTAPPPDITPPTLMSATPAPRSGNVPTNTRLSLTFSEAMNIGSLLLTVDPDLNLGTPTWTNGNQTVSFNSPMSDWPPAASILVTIEGTDVAGNPLAPMTAISFGTAAPPDTTRPTVVSTAPQGSATAVPFTTNIEFNFSEPMDVNSVQAAFSSTPAITCNWFWNAQRTLGVCDPSVNLAASTGYNITMGTGARDDANNTLQSAFTFSFTTAAAPDTTRPTVISTTPANNAVGVPRSVFNFPFSTPSTISVSFSEPMSQSSAQGAFSITSPTGFNGGTFTWNSSGRTMTYTPPTSFPYGQQVTFSIAGGATGATDLAGNSLQTTYTSTFRIKRRTTASFLNTSASAALDGFLTSTSGCGSITPSVGSTVAAAGDSTTNLVYRGYLTFSLASLTSLANVNITSATLNTTQVSCSGNPFTTTFGSTIEAWHVNYGPSLEAADCSTSNLGSRQYTLSNSTALTLKTVSVIDAVEDDWTNRVSRGNRSQFMLRTATIGTDSDGSADWCSQGTYNTTTTSNRPYLSITYEYD